VTDNRLETIRGEYPFEPNALDVGGARMSYLDEGPRGAPCVVMLHGNPTWSFYYRRLVLDLRGAYRVIVPDHVGCGLSGKPRDYDYTLERRIDDIRKLIDHLGLSKISLAAHDWGGAIGFGFAARRPETIRSFTVFNTAAFRSDRIPFRITICRWPLVGALAVRGLNGFVRAALPPWGMATKKPERFTREVIRGYLLPYDSWARRIAVHRFVRDIPLRPGDRSYETLENIEKNLGRFRDTPMQLLWGMGDWCFDAGFLAEWVHRFPAAAVHTFDDAGHYVVEDAHERIAPLMRRFLDALP